MESIKSCGAVVFTRCENDLLYVIIRQTNGDYGFPKGRMEPGEDEQTTALREIREEVGLTAAIMDGFREESRYPFPGKPNVIKQVVYFLAEYADQPILCQPMEVDEAYLLPYQEALELLSFPQTKHILTQANDYLTK